MSAHVQERLIYAQNWEDPCLEIEALEIGEQDVVLATAGAGCTALSLLACGPRKLVAVDRSEAQIRLVALKLATVRALDAEPALAFLDPASGRTRSARVEDLRRVRAFLASDDARYWDGRREQITRGILGEGRAEKFLSVLGALIRLFVHPRARARALFDATSLSEQARFYEETWDSRRWRLLFRFLGRKTIDRGLGGAFYAHLDGPDFGEALHARARRCLTELPIAESYFLSRILLGEFPRSVEGRPPYLAPGGIAGVRQHAERITLVRASLIDHLRAQPDESIDKLYLSNVAEWMNDTEREALFREVARVGRRGGRVAYRALAFERPLPASVRDVLVPDEALSCALEARDRACINASFRVARIERAS
jgi:S-adenosylmethionine-diacylglycerol 3-amino-3-carboxypropyl transferase